MSKVDHPEKKPDPPLDPRKRFKGKTPLYGVPWSDEEHQLFLNGLKTYGRGEWTMIAKNVIRSRTPSQVASHAQKYFKRKESRIDYEAISKKRMCIGSDENLKGYGSGLELISSLVLSETESPQDYMIKPSEEPTTSQYHELHASSGHSTNTDQTKEPAPVSTHGRSEAWPQGPPFPSHPSLDADLPSFDPPNKPQIVRLLPFSLAIPQFILANGLYLDGQRARDQHAGPGIRWSPLHSLTLPAPPTPRCSPSS